MNPVIEKVLQSIVDAASGLIPQPAPSTAQLRQCRIVSHRGEHDNIKVLENTRPAFDAAVAAGVWGLEFDIQWSRDGQPVVHHDRDCHRVFQTELCLEDVTRDDLRNRLPDILDLHEMVKIYGRRAHLMIELKNEGDRPLSKSQVATLAETLKGLEPVRDYHIMGLNAAVLSGLDFAPPEALLSISLTNAVSMSRLALQEGYGGVTGHYLLLTDEIVRRHKAEGQDVGTGFIKSQNVLWRELNRGIAWIYSNDAVALQTLVSQELARRARNGFADSAD